MFVRKVDANWATDGISRDAGGERWVRLAACGGLSLVKDGNTSVFDNYFSVRCGDVNIMTIF